MIKRDFNHYNGVILSTLSHTLSKKNLETEQYECFNMV